MQYSTYSFLNRKEKADFFTTNDDKHPSSYAFTKLGNVQNIIGSAVKPRNTPFVKHSFKFMQAVLRNFYQSSVVPESVK